MAIFDLTCTVNNETIRRAVPADMTLLAFLRDELGLTGTKEGCGEGDCGACTVLVDGKNVNSCLFPVIQAEGRSIMTIEGVSRDGKLSGLQEAFLSHGAVQCGFCSPGMIMSAMALLSENPHPTEDEVRYGMAGNLCRCTGYQAIVDAILDYAENTD